MNNKYYIGDAWVNFDTLTIKCGESINSIEPKVMKVLRVLSENQNQVFTREDLINAVWGVDFGGDERLSRAISLLRKALGKKSYIQTISKTGYRLTAPIRKLPDQEEFVEVKKTIETTSQLQKTTRPKQIAPIPNVAVKNKKQRPKLWLAVTGTLALLLMGGLFISTQHRNVEIVAVQDVSFNDNMRKGVDHIQNFGRPDAIENAQKLFNEILNKDSEHAGARAGLAIALIREYTAEESDPALLKRAKASADIALAKDDHLALSHIASGWSHTFNRNFDEAVKYFDQADILDKNNVLTLEGRYQAFRGQRNIEALKNVLEKSIALYPEHSGFYAYKSEIQNYQNDYDGAEQSARKAISFDADNPRLYSNLAHMLHMKGQNEKAVKTLQDGLKINETAQLYSNLGTYLFFQGQYELASSAFEKSLGFKGNSHNPLYWANLGDAYRWVAGKQDQAKEAHTRALQLWTKELESSPQDVNLKTRIALYQSKVGLNANALSIIETVSFEENMPSTYFYRAAVTYEALGDRYLALNMLEKATESGYPLTEVRNDPELRALRQDVAYHRLLVKLGAKNGTKN